MAHVRDIHNALHVVADIAEELFKNVLHDVAAQIADMREVINGRSAGVHADLARLVRSEGLHLLCKGVVKIEFAYLHFIFHPIVIDIYS